MTKQILPKRWILIRGLTRSYFHWFEFIDIFKKEFQLESVETPELPGNGYLFNQRSPKNISIAITELKKQILKSDEPIGLIGISLGGVIATKWALSYPEEISHLVIINSSFSNSPFYHRLILKNYFKIIWTVLFGNYKKIEKFVLTVTSNTENWKSKFDLCTQFQKNHPTHLSNLIKQLKLASESNFVNKPDCNVLILTSENDRLVNYKCSLKIAKSWNTKVNTHPTAGHDLPLDDTAWIIQTIKTEFKY